MKLLELKKVSKAYTSNIGEFKILDDVNLSLQNKENIFLFGPSGCGKSTLLNILAGLDYPDDGEIYFQNQLIKKNSLELFRKDLGIIFQDHYLISELSIFDNIKLKCDSHEEIKEILKYFELLDIKNNFPNQLSNGQKQRVCVARSLVSRPKILIADEPTSYLDRENADLVINLILTASKKFDISTVVASHDMSFQPKFDKSYTIVNKNLILC